MASEDREFDAISDYVIDILRSPTWIAPISKFVDENCGVFEDQEENKLEYTIIHNAFKSLIDDLLAAHLLELSVTEEQFTRFCQHGLTGDNELYRGIVEQLLSVDDFLVFKAMMAKRNADLGREVMMVKGDEDIGQEGSWQQAEQLEVEKRCVEAELQMAQALELQLEKRLELMEELNKLLDLICTVYKLQARVLAVEAAAEEASAQEAAAAQAAAQVAAQQAAEPELALPPTVRLQPLASVPAPRHELGGPPDAAALALEAKRAEASLQRNRALAAAAATAPQAEAAPLVAEPHAMPQASVAAYVPPRPTEEERQARAEHLRRNRAALLERKNHERQSQLNAYEQQHGPTAASRAAEQACARSGPQSQDGKLLAAELSGQVMEAPQQQTTEADSKALQMRQMLARQLRATLTQSPP